MRAVLALSLVTAILGPARGGELEARRARWVAERGRATAALAVLGVLELRDRQDFTRVDAFVTEAAGDVRAHPLARAQAAFAAESLARRLGRDSSELRRRLGIVETWRVIGPFSNTSGEGFARVFPPEEELTSGKPIALEARPAGKRRPVAWRTVPAKVVVGGVVPVGAMLRPDDEATAYAMAWVKSDAARDAAVRVGSTGPIKVWVNRELILQHDVRERPLRPDQDAAPVRLAAGWNLVFVKTSVREAAWAFRLRFSGLDGGELPLESALDASGAAASRQKAPPRARLVDLGTGVRARKGPAGLRDLALYHALVAPDGEEGAPVEAALEGAGHDPATLILLMRHGETSDGRRRAAEALLAHAPSRAEAATALAVHYLDDAERPGRADELYAAALAADPGAWPAALGRARRLAVLDLLETALFEVGRLSRAHPRVAEISRELASLERRRGRPREAEAILRALLETRRTDLSLLGDLAELAEGRGDAVEALRLYEAMTAARPDSVTGYASLADARKRVGRPLPELLAAYDEGLALAPEDDRLLEASGRLLVDRGGPARRPEGIARLKRALAFRPQNPDLRRLLGRLDAGYADDLEDAYARRPKALAERYAGFRDPESGATVLLDQKVTRVHDNGLSEVYVQRIVRIDEESAADDQRVQEIQYTPSTQTLEVRAARVYKASGEILESASRADREVSEPWYGLYYDVRAESVRFARLEKGDVVELSYVIADVGRRNLLSDYFGDLYYFAETAPRAESQYVLLAPASRELSFHIPAGVKQTIDTVRGEKRWRFRAERVPRVSAEDRMPGWTEAAPYLHVSTYGRWQQVARWYWGLIEPQLGADEAVRRAAREAVARVKTVDEKVRAIHNLVVKRTRYVGLEFGIHGFQPYRVAQVWQRKFGDCKDKASLIVTMLREVGVKAYPVLVRTRRNGEVGQAPASLAVFDHAIAYVPELDLWLDGTAEFSGSRELPSEDQGVTVLVIDGGDGKFTTTPVLPAADNETSRRLTVTLATRGSARLEEETAIHGQNADDLRRYYQAPGERRSKYEKFWNAWFPAARLEAVEMPRLEELERPVEIRARGTVPELGRAVEGGRQVPAIGRPSELALRMARTSTRKHDLVLEYPWVEREVVVWKLPEGARATIVPQPQTIESPFGKLSLQAAAAGREVTVTWSLEIAKRRIRREEYKSFRAFLVAVDSALNQVLELGK